MSIERKGRKGGEKRLARNRSLILSCCCSERIDSARIEVPTCREAQEDSAELRIGSA